MSSPHSVPPLGDLLDQLSEEPSIEAALGRREPVIAVADPGRAFVIAGLVAASDRRPVLVGTPTQAEAERLAADAAAILGDDKVLHFPAWETLPFERVSPGFETMGQRLAVLDRLTSDHPPSLVVASARALIQRIDPHATIDPIEVRPGDQVDPVELVEQLVSGGLVTCYGDLYRLTADQLSNLERMGKKSSDNLIQAVETSKTRGLEKLLTAMSIRHVGNTVAATLGRRFGTLDRLASATVEELSSIHEVGDAIAQSVVDFFESDHGQRDVADLRSIGVSMDALGQQELGDLLLGKTLVVTGTLNRHSRDEIQELIRQNGGKAGSSVSKKTDFLVAGEKAGSKLTKAKNLGIKIITEDEFLQMIGT